MGVDNYGFAHTPASGRSGELIVVWDSLQFEGMQAMRDDELLAVIGKWKGFNIEVGFMNVYAPMILAKRKFYGIAPPRFCLLFRFRGACSATSMRRGSGFLLWFWIVSIQIIRLSC